MSKYQLKCSCIKCGTQTTVQSLKAHLNKCTSEPKNKCICCGKGTNNDKFCSRSCRATVINSTRVTKATLRVQQRKSRKEVREEQENERFINGEILERPTLRKHLARTIGYKCSCCGLSEWNNKPITLIVDHVNGNAGDNTPQNLRLLCPNCNSQTSTFGGRNKGNGRKSRGLPLS